MDSTQEERLKRVQENLEEVIRVREETQRMYVCGEIDREQRDQALIRQYEWFIFESQPFQHGLELDID